MTELTSDIKREIGEVCTRFRLSYCSFLIRPRKHFIFGFDGYEPTEGIIKLIQEHYVGYGVRLSPAGYS